MTNVECEAACRRDAAIIVCTLDGDQFALCPECYGEWQRGEDVAKRVKESRN